MPRGDGAIFSKKPDSMGEKTSDFCFKTAGPGPGFFAMWETGGVGCILEPLLRERERVSWRTGGGGKGDPIKDRAGLFFTEMEEERCANIGDIFRGNYLGSPPFVTFVQENAGELFSERLVFINTEATYVKNFFRQGTM